MLYTSVSDFLRRYFLMESNSKSQKSNRQSDKTEQSRSNRVEFANELDMNVDKKSDRSDKSNKNSR
jgi:hypothetical protein